MIVVKSNREEILKNLRKELPSRNLYDLAKRHGIPTEIRGKKNKGWVGQTVEKAAGLSLSSAQEPDGLDCELKTTTLVFKEGRWVPKETIKITQLNPKQILNETLDVSGWKDCEYYDRKRNYMTNEEIEQFDKKLFK